MYFFLERVKIPIYRKMYEKIKGCIPNITKVHYILYKTENLINGKFYYGVHATNNLRDGYLGSGKILKKAILKYGKENFLRTDLEFFNSMEEAYSREGEVVTEELIKDPNCYNAKLGGLGGTKGLTTIYFQGEYQKIPLSLLEDFIALGAEHKSSLKGKPSPLKGRKQSEEHLRHRSDALKGHVGYPGKKKPEGFGEKIRQARLGAESHTQGKERIWKDGVQIFIQTENLPEYLQNGWIRTKDFRVVKRQGEPAVLVSKKEAYSYLKQGFSKSTYRVLGLEYGIRQ